VPEVKLLNVIMGCSTEMPDLVGTDVWSDSGSVWGIQRFAGAERLHPKVMH
jgi:hypothetical protein